VTQIALSEAQEKLAELVKAVSRGEQFVITIDGAPAAVVSPPKPTEARRRPRYGSAQGQIWMSDDFDAPLDDFADYM
jgi:prevent-host-death family protein